MAALAAVIAPDRRPVSHSLETAGTTHSGGFVSAGPTVAAGTASRAAGRRVAVGRCEPAARRHGRPGRLLDRDSVSGRGRGRRTVQSSRRSKASAASYTWVAAATDSEPAAVYQLATRSSVMPIGGFTGGDPIADAQQFQGLRRATQGSLLHPRAASVPHSARVTKAPERPAPRRRSPLGQVALPLDDDRRRDALRPHLSRKHEDERRRRMNSSSVARWPTRRPCSAAPACAAMTMEPPARPGLPRRG